MNLVRILHHIPCILHHFVPARYIIPHARFNACKIGTDFGTCKKSCKNRARAMVSVKAIFAKECSVCNSSLSLYLLLSLTHSPEQSKVRE